VPHAGVTPCPPLTVIPWLPHACPPWGIVTAGSGWRGSILNRPNRPPNRLSPSLRLPIRPHPAPYAYASRPVPSQCLVFSGSGPPPRAGGWVTNGNDKAGPAPPAISRSPYAWASLRVSWPARWDTPGDEIRQPLRARCRLLGNLISTLFFTARSQHCEPLLSFANHVDVANRRNWHGCHA